MDFGWLFASRGSRTCRPAPQRRRACRTISNLCRILRRACPKVAPSQHSTTIAHRLSQRQKSRKACDTTSILRRAYHNTMIAQNLPRRIAELAAKHPTAQILPHSTGEAVLGVCKRWRHCGKATATVLRSSGRPTSSPVGVFFASSNVHQSSRGCRPSVSMIHRLWLPDVAWNCLQLPDYSRRTTRPAPRGIMRSTGGKDKMRKDRKENCIISHEQKKITGGSGKRKEWIGYAPPVPP